MKLFIFAAMLILFLVGTALVYDVTPMEVTGLTYGYLFGGFVVTILFKYDKHEE